MRLALSSRSPTPSSYCHSRKEQLWRSSPLAGPPLSCHTEELKMHVAARQPRALPAAYVPRRNSLPFSIFTETDVLPIHRRTQSFQANEHSSIPTLLSSAHKNYSGHWLISNPYSDIPYFTRLSLAPHVVLPIAARSPEGKRIAEVHARSPYSGPSFHVSAATSSTLAAEPESAALVKLPCDSASKNSASLKPSIPLPTTATQRIAKTTDEPLADQVRSDSPVLKAESVTILSSRSPSSSFPIPNEPFSKRTHMKGVPLQGTRESVAKKASSHEVSAVVNDYKKSDDFRTDNVAHLSLGKSSQKVQAILGSDLVSNKASRLLRPKLFVASSISVSCYRDKRPSYIGRVWKSFREPFQVK